MAEVTRRRAITLETLAIGSLLLPSILAKIPGAAFAYAHVSVAQDVLSTVRYASYLGILIFVIWTSGDGFATFGFRKADWWRLPGRVVLLHILAWAPLVSTLLLARSAPGGLRFMPPPTALADVVTVIDIVAASVVIQSITFGYLMTRAEELTGSIYGAVAISAILFGLQTISLRNFHALDALLILGQGVCYAVAFALTRSIWPQILTLAVYLGCSHLIFLHVWTMR